MKWICREKIRILLALMAMSVFAKAQSSDTCQSPKWAIYQVQPLGLTMKERIKLERRLTPTSSVSLAYTKFYGIATDNQVFGEYRYYRWHRKKTELFFYGKAGIGAGTTDGFETGNPYGPYKYALVGGGAGWHIGIGKKQHLFFDISMGLKYAGVYSVSDNITNGDPQTTFYLFGPGSVIDICSYFGWQFR
jgi:hypothetical protein